MKHERNRFRIIAGEWRGRPLHFPDAQGLRPTGDRVRETLFNWLQPLLPGAHCLDLFAGSGALSFEALSRGATSVTTLEPSPVAARAIAANCRLLDDQRLQLIQTDARRWLADSTPRAYDIVFLDPPFGAGLLQPCCELLAARGWLAPRARVYLESGEPLRKLTLPAGWTLLRDKQAGQVHYGLCAVEEEA